MSLLEKIQSMKMPFAELKGVTFTEAGMDRVVAKMLVRPAALLCLDEPTNHLDLASREVLDGALARFPGTIVFISHDRYFINRIATKIVEVGGGALASYLGSYDDYLAAKARGAVAAAPGPAPGRSRAAERHAPRTSPASPAAGRPAEGPRASSGQRSERGARATRAVRRRALAGRGREPRESDEQRDDGDVGLTHDVPPGGLGFTPMLASEVIEPAVRGARQRPMIQTARRQSSETPSRRRCSSHSTGSSDFFLVLHALHAGTALPRVERPPRPSGTMWSIVRLARPTMPRQ